MFRQLLGFAADRLQRLGAECSRRAKLWWERSREPDKNEERGLNLLREWLSPQQLAQYDARKYFDVIGSQSGRRYRIYHGTAANVREIDGAGRPRDGWCFVPDARLVAGDVMLAQKIALETDERRALSVARSFL
ncbi:hypothetical protein SAMN05444159_0750 [Bradyrhizobium lablabi]|uniref:Uncharacterized protein n=1 Tax=Bradyrhizobium lablabi TaxID=722472 RepID=A0A1M6JQY0_9BRAD|nr:hypothetical protein SAMN05444159_0750 [Bradyrhizobium lablabi]